MLHAVNRVLRRLKNDHVMALGLVLLVLFGGVGSAAWLRVRDYEAPAKTCATCGRPENFGWCRRCPIR